MFYIQIHKSNKQALYIQLSNQIRQAIESGVLSHGDQLPTDESICEQFNISQIVVKQAYEKLMVEGLIRRIRGKGTYVSSVPHLKIPLDQVEIIEQHYRDMGVERHYNLIETIDHHFLAPFYMPDQDEQSFWRVVITGQLKNAPVYYEETIFPCDRFPKLNSILHNPEIDLVRLVQDLFKVKIDTKLFELNLVNLSASEASILNVEHESVAHMVVSSYHAMDESILFYSRTLYPAEYVSFSFNREEKSL